VLDGQFGMQAGQPGLGKTTFVDNLRSSFGQPDNDPVSSATSNPLGDLITLKCRDEIGNNVDISLQVCTPNLLWWDFLFQQVTWMGKSGTWGKVLCAYSMQSIECRHEDLMFL
jgi:hypothetical protein